MLSRVEIATIKTELERLEENRQQCTDGGIRRVIDAWINEQREKLRSDSNSQLA
jgi:hypothetical protein